MRTNQYSPTYLPRDHNLQKRNPWKNGSVPSFQFTVSFPGTDETFATTEKERIERDETSIQRKKAAPTRATFSLRANESFSREEFACIPLPTRKSFVLRGITYRLISFSHIFPSKTTGIIVENLSSPVVAIP